MSDILKPCPFCGGKAELHLFQMHAEDEPYAASISCPECGVNGAEEWMVDGKDFKQRAIKKWNRRMKE
jgi:Lar family restriction alleviation protein